MHLDEEETHPLPGNFVIQRGTIRNWFNQRAQPSVAAVVLIVTGDGMWTGWQLGKDLGRRRRE